MYVKIPNPKCFDGWKIVHGVVYLYTCGMLCTPVYMCKACCTLSWDCGVQTPVDWEEQKKPTQHPLLRFIQRIDVLNIACSELYISHKLIERMCERKQVRAGVATFSIIVHLLNLINPRPSITKGFKSYILSALFQVGMTDFYQQ